MNKHHILTGFHLKIIAMISMLMDHIGLFLIPMQSSFYLIFRIIGRISFPLFAFLIVEGTLHSKKPLIYISKLAGLSIIIDIFTFIFTKEYTGCVLMNFALCALTIHILEKENKFAKLYALIPFSFIILSGFNFFPFHFQYGPYGAITILSFYASYKIANLILDKTSFYKEEYFNFLYHILCALSFIILTIITIVFSNEINLIFSGNYQNYFIQSYSIISLIFIYFYNGKRGYNKPWFKHGCYLFFPLHVAIIYLIYFIIF